MAYLDDWLEAMTEGADPQEASRLRRTTRGPTLRDLLGRDDSFQLMGPNGQVDVARTEEFLNRPNRGPSLETGNFSVFSPEGSLNAESAQTLSNYLKANPSLAMSPEERQGQEKEAEAIRERDLYTRAQGGDREAVAEFERRKGQQLNLKMLIDLAKGDPDTARALLGRLIPGLPKQQSVADRKRQEKIDAEERAQRNREETFVFQNLGSYINKQTGQKAMELPEAPTLDEIKKNYAKMSPTQMTNIDALRGLDNQIEQYNGVLSALDFPDPGLGVITSGIDIKRRRVLGDPKVRRLDAIRGEITQLARAFGGDSRVSDKEMERLENAVLKDFESNEGATEAINVLKEFRDSRARAIGIPGLISKKGKSSVDEKDQFTARGEAPSKYKDMSNEELLKELQR